MLPAKKLKYSIVWQSHYSTIFGICKGVLKIVILDLINCNLSVRMRASGGKLFGKKLGKNFQEFGF